MSGLGLDREPCVALIWGQRLVLDIDSAEDRAREVNRRKPTPGDRVAFPCGDLDHPRDPEAAEVIEGVLLASAACDDGVPVCIPDPGPLPPDARVWLACSGALAGGVLVVGELVDSSAQPNVIVGQYSDQTPHKLGIVGSVLARVSWDADHTCEVDRAKLVPMSRSVFVVPTFD